jgi:hypothetical protein
VRAVWEAAQSHAEHVITLVPQHEQAVSLLATSTICLILSDDSSQEM